MRGELDKANVGIIDRDVAIAKLENQLSVADAELEDQVLTIAELETKLSGVISELEARDMAIATLKTELEARVENDKQLNLFPPDREPTPEPEPMPTQKPPAGTLSRGELVKYILEKFPGSKINGQNITDAINGKSKNLPKFEGEYGFKFIGKIKGENRFKLV
ncbi:hypothetical protein NO976_04431 (plasmid) [Planktothrix agardhii]|uniref:hypothetical protein n=1 Tax=Planktothrix agardhii TaxID=1160 RepID=UPI0020A7FC72|nr:hypothetical protein [Planktothrix agardhii]CAD5984499.1 hypothetical protein NO976_04431 [Planktothrix agardhii]